MINSRAENKDPAEQYGHFRKKNAYYYSLLDDLLRFLIPEGCRVLDLGCGTGERLEVLRPSYGVGVDISEDLISYAQARYAHLHFRVGDIEDLRLPAEPFDYILVCNTIGYLKDVQAMFSGLRRYCSPETRVVVIYYNYLWEPILKFSERLGLKIREPQLNWLSLRDIENLCSLTGYEVIRERQGILMPKKIPLLSCLMNTYLANLPVFWRLGLVEALVARPFLQPSAGELSCSVVVPARNERGNIEELVRRLPLLGSHTEIIFVEGHSKDGTLDEIRRVQDLCPSLDIKVLIQDGEGKADAVRKGFWYATGDVLMILDADLSVRPEELPKFYEAIASGRGELVIGCRLIYQLEDEAMRFLNLVGNKFFSLVFSFLLGQRIKDTLCGTKVLRRHHYRKIAEGRGYFGELDPFGDFDLIFGAAKANLKIVEIPVRYQARRYGETQIKRFRHGLLLFRMVWVAMKKLKFV